MATPSVTLSTPVPADLANKVKHAANLSHKSVASWLRDLVTRAIAESYRETPEPTLEEFLG